MKPATQGPFHFSARAVDHQFDQVSRKAELSNVIDPLGWVKGERESGLTDMRAIQDRELNTIFPLLGNPGTYVHAINGVRSLCASRNLMTQSCNFFGMDCLSTGRLITSSHWKSARSTYVLVSPCYGPFSPGYMPVSHANVHENTTPQPGICHRWAIGQVSSTSPRQTHIHSNKSAWWAEPIGKADP